MNYCKLCKDVIPYVSYDKNGKKLRLEHRVHCIKCVPYGIVRLSDKKGTLAAFDEEKFKEAVRLSSSVTEVMRRLDRLPSAGRHTTTKKRIKYLGLDTSHFTGQGYLKGRVNNFSPKRPLSELLVENKYYPSNPLRKRLIREGIFEEKCSRCGRTEWEGEKIPLELDHINGVHDDNRLENLRILCCNCHALTETYGNKNKKDTEKRVRKFSPVFRKYNGSLKILDLCICCNIQPYVFRRLCDNCLRCSRRRRKLPKDKCNDRSHTRKVKWPTQEELHSLLWSIPTTKIAKQYGVSDNAVAKWAKCYGLQKPPCGYWAKVAAGKPVDKPIFGSTVKDRAELPHG